MTDHIYGRENIVTNSKRPHMFIAELHLYIDYLKEELTADIQTGLLDKKKKWQRRFYKGFRPGGDRTGLFKLSIWHRE